MTVSWRYILAGSAAVALMAGAAEAGGKGDCKGCQAGPPPPPPPCYGCGHNFGHKIVAPDIHIGGSNIHIGGPKISVKHGGVNVNKTSVNVNVEANASAGAVAIAGARGLSGSNVVYGGGGYFSPDPAPSQGMANICVEEEELVTTRELVEKLVSIRAACIDDRGAPHPASQLFPEEAVEVSYDGELYRCPAGSYLQVTVGEAEGAYEGGSTMVCGKGEALYHTPGGELICRPQSEERNCFERSLLRKYGPGSKTVLIKREEEFTKKVAKACPPAAGGFYMSGGVGAY